MKLVRESQPLRPYFKIIAGVDEVAFYGYLPLIQRNEIEIYALNESYEELDYICIRQEGIGHLMDIWVDCKTKKLYVVYEGSIGRYNLNGDYLGQFMKAPGNTRYVAMVTYGDCIYLGYERKGCSYIGEYDSDGVYCGKEVLDCNGQITSIEVEEVFDGIKIHAFVKRRGGICQCVTFLSSRMPIKNQICRSQNSICYY